MKIRLWGLIAFDILAMFTIVHATGLVLKLPLMVILLLANALLAMVFHRVQPLRADSSGSHIISLLQSTSWTDYLPLLGGSICEFVGLIELSWKLCVIGAV